MHLVPTGTVIEGLPYEVGSTAFFQHFSAAWEAAQHNVIKLETRQNYQEPASPSYQAMRSGNLPQAVASLPQERQADAELYADLAKRNVRFTRCRPVRLPLTPYLAWEFEAYKINASFGERIYCGNTPELHNLIENAAQHDFMVFDDRHAFIHNYNAAGLIEGGWMTEDPRRIENLRQLYQRIQSHCQPFEDFLATL